MDTLKLTALALFIPLGWSVSNFAAAYPAPLVEDEIHAPAEEITACRHWPLNAPNLEPAPGTVEATVQQFLTPDLPTQNLEPRIEETDVCLRALDLLQRP